jgi:ribulose-phosphate 3-epimerase
MDMLISASILSADFSRLAEEIRAAEAGGADWIHIDVMDGQFVPNITMGPFIVEACRRITELPLDVHLMIEKPENHLHAFARAGASILTVHVETCPHIYKTLQAIRDLGCHPGVVINPGTPASSLDAVLNLVDLVLILTVNPGYSGQEFIPEVLPKVQEIRRKLDAIRSDAWLEVDGGITPENLPEVWEAGARAFVAATSIFKYPAGIAAGIRALRSKVPV